MLIIRPLVCSGFCEFQLLHCLPGSLLVLGLNRKVCFGTSHSSILSTCSNKYYIFLFCRSLGTLLSLYSLSYFYPVLYIPLLREHLKEKVERIHKYNFTMWQPFLRCYLEANTGQWIKETDVIKSVSNTCDNIQGILLKLLMLFMPFIF
jgi:hypothetical protein